MSHPFLQLLLRWSVLALGVTLAAELVPGIRCETFGTLVVVVLVLSFLNAVLRPLLVLFTLPFIVVTLGFGIVLINAFLFLLVSRVVDGFSVASFWSALAGAVIVGLTNLVLSNLLGGSRRRRGPDDRRGPPPGRGGPPAARPGRGGDDVIDV